nr:SH2 domain-containing adapter protein D isoform X1 [Chrysemys picta bellii]XP_042697417.1 SH2 domain-containing adapter protein D isoform X1 [Chrysemys picta bellii]XP_042697418.1 SH2 domain-containing adapter protein D isoform X1 [Chrysemys picta bellii]XP_042697419.1 SH2 domain-containing adapter protein D isoform X1 [Chrysemys picta bellii]XP_042697420.1 SH2 domain-containing adapter protein D isoform X1 [Chrysemys picta bellii]XP_042697421.1 SH2 domain-containing adapter protein D isofo
MAKWLKDYLSFGSRRSPPQPPTPDYTESEILKAYRAQKSMDFEDPYEDSDNKLEPDPGGSGSPNTAAAGGCAEGKYTSPKHRLIKVESKALLTTAAEELKGGQEQGDGDSEYSDPFDARREQPGDAEETVPENNGYMEPYDAQRVVADLQGKGDWEGRWGKQYQQGLQLYDTPYEEQERDPEGGPASPARESRLPQDDERPADEYDQPWEWKKDHISRAFAAVQFENPDWERPSSLNKERRRPPKHLTAGPKHGRSQSPERSPPVAERVDPSLPLEKQVWYHGSISRADAETLLTLCKEGSYLVRNSETSHHDYSLSLRSTQGFMHMKFTRTRENKYVLGQNSAPFESIPEVIHYYTVRELPVKGAEQLSLLYPVAVQTL